MTPQQVLKHYTTQVAAAEAAKVTQPAVARWVKVNRVPALAQMRLAKDSAGVLRVDPKVL